MSEQTPAQQEHVIKVFSLAMWGAVIGFAVLAGLFYFKFIPSEQGDLIAVFLGAIAIGDIFLIRFMVKKMRANIDKP